MNDIIQFFRSSLVLPVPLAREQNSLSILALCFPGFQSIGPPLEAQEAITKLLLKQICI